MIGRSARLTLGLALICSCLGSLAWAASASASGLSVSVGYADNLRADPTHFPTPFGPGPGITYEGCTPALLCTFDGGVIKIVNTGFTSTTIDSVVAGFDVCRFDLWPHEIVLAGGGTLILAQTASGATDGCTPGTTTDVASDMDSSDIGLGGADWSGNCTQSGLIPTVDVTVGGNTTTYTDSGQVLNTGGIDVAECPPGSNESEQWTTIGSPPCPSTALTLTPPSQTLDLGQSATVTATLTNAGGPNCGQPLSDVPVAFTGTGPNAPISGSGTTNASGQATFSYTGTKAGTDTLSASVTNLAGTITSNPVTVNWTPPTYTGDAYDVYLDASVLGIVKLGPATINEVGPVSTMATSNDTKSILTESLPLLGLSGGQLTSGVVTGSDISTGSASTNGLSLKVPLLGLPAISTGEVSSSSQTACSTSNGTTSSTGSTNIAALKIGTITVKIPATIKPNTKINLLGLGSVTLNEQTPIMDGLAVNAIDIKIGVKLLGTDVQVIIGHSESDVEDC